VKIVSEFIMELSDVTVELRCAILGIQSGISDNDDSEAIEAYFSGEI